MGTTSFSNFLQKRQDSVVLGKVSGSLFKAEELTEGQLNHHVHIVGASGYGKTVLLSHLVKQRIQQGKGLIFIDLKGEQETILKFVQFVAQSNRIDDLRTFSLSDPQFSFPYNLIGQGTATQLRDKIMSSLNWSEEFYKSQSASYLLKLLIGLCFLRDKQDFKFHLGTILKACESKDYVGELSYMLPDSEIETKSMFESCYDFLNAQDNFKSLQGLRTQLESLVLSDFGKMLTSNDPGVDLYETVSQGKIAFLFLDSRRYGETAKAVGKFILQDLKMVSAKVDAEIPRDQRKPITVVIDEFADLAQEDFIAFLDRARSSKMSVVLAHQEICDLLRISPEFAGRLMGNTSTLYAFLQKRPESAEVISKMGGTKKAYKETIQMGTTWLLPHPTGTKSLREVEEFNIHPNLIKSLKVGKCVAIKKYPEARAYLVNVSP